MDALTVLLFIAGFGLLIVGAEAVVRGARHLAAASGVSPLMIGLTVVAYGTSSPELAVGVDATYAGKGGLALGNVVGSNICNVLFVLGLTAAVASLDIARRLVRLDVWVLIVISLLTFVLGLDGRISRADGLLLAGGSVLYTVWLIREGRKENAAVPAAGGGKVARHTPARKLTWFVNLGWLALGVAFLVVGAEWLVDGAVAFARAWGVSELIIGLTVVAIGTSLPELGTSVVATIRGERDIAVGNVVGSSIFNILAVLGLTAAVAPSGVEVPRAVLLFDIPVMIAVAIVCAPIFFTGYRMERWEGGLLLGYYAAYLVYLVLNATESAALDLYRTSMVWAVLPLTLVILVIGCVRSASRHRPKSGLGEQLL